MDAQSLAEMFSYLTDASLLRAACVSTLWRSAAAQPGVWRSVYARMYGEHSARWAHVHEPVSSSSADEWKLRCEQRMRAAACREAGLARCRSLPFDPGDGESLFSAPFYIFSVALDGPWLATGEVSGMTSLMDCRSGRRRWRQPHWTSSSNGAAGLQPSSDEDLVITDLSVCAVGGVVAALAGELGLALIRSIDNGDVLYVLDHRRLLSMHAPLSPALDQAALDALQFSRICVYAPHRLGPEASGLGGLRVMSAGFGEEDGPPLACIWLLDEHSPRAQQKQAQQRGMHPPMPPPIPRPIEPRLLRHRRGLMSEQGGVIVELRSFDLSNAVHSGERTMQVDLLLFDLLTVSIRSSHSNPAPTSHTPSCRSLLPLSLSLSALSLCPLSLPSLSALWRSSHA